MSKRVHTIFGWCVWDLNGLLGERRASVGYFAPNAWVGCNLPAGRKMPAGTPFAVTQGKPALLSAY
jgi:hypothetical protein